MSEQFHLILEGGDAAYWSIIRAMRDAGFEVVLDFQPAGGQEIHADDPEDRLFWRMTIRPGFPRDMGAAAEEITPVVEIPAPVPHPFTEERIAAGMDLDSANVYGLNITALKRILREWLTTAITRGNYTIEEAERLFNILNLE